MNRRQYLAGAASITGFSLLAGCSGNDGGSENAGGGNGGGSGGSDSNDGGDGATNAGAGSGTPTEDTSSILPTEGDEAIDTGQAPPDVTQTPFENTNTVPEIEGLETGQAPNSTDESS